MDASKMSQNSKILQPTLPTRFSNAEEYTDFFYDLIELESNFRSSSDKSSMPKKVSVTDMRWKDLSNGKVNANFSIVYDEAVWKPKTGEKWRLTHTGDDKNWTSIGRVIKLPRNREDYAVLELETSKDIPRDELKGFSVSHVMNSATYDRQVKGLIMFSEHNRFFEDIIGLDVKPARLFVSNKIQLHSTPTLPPLSEEQQNVVKFAIQNRLTLFEGPSGSGKSTTLLACAYNLVQQNSHKGPILVCAQTNLIVDHLASALHNMNLRVVRLFAETSPVSPLTQFLSLENQIRKLLSTKPSDSEEDKLRDKAIAERAVLEATEVICCTCISAGDERLNFLKFYAILIDESMQATEPECMIPISLGCEHLILASDECQLEPVIQCEEATAAGLKRSLYQRLEMIGVQPLYLTVHFRMPQTLWQYPATHYQRSSLSAVSLGERKLDALPWPNPSVPLILYDVRGLEERAGSSYTYVNDQEASKVQQIVTQLLKGGISPSRIGVITQYDPQKDRLIKLLNNPEIEVGKPDSYQGREKDIIIVSCVRSQGDTGLGSLGYQPRFHLVITRAKFGLVIVGSLTALRRQPVWRDFIKFCQLQGVVIGEFDRW